MVRDDNSGKASLSLLSLVKQATHINLVPRKRDAGNEVGTRSSLNVNLTAPYVNVIADSIKRKDEIFYFLVQSLMLYACVMFVLVLALRMKDDQESRYYHSCELTRNLSGKINTPLFSFRVKIYH